MRRAALLLFISMISLTVPAASVTGGSEVRPGLFYSEEELGKISFDDELPDSDREYYGNIDISIITAAPAEPVYIYFGHSGLSVEIPGREGIMFDYGTFSFSESFYHDFIFGLKYGHRFGSLFRLYVSGNIGYSAAADSWNNMWLFGGTVTPAFAISDNFMVQFPISAYAGGESIVIDARIMLTLHFDVAGEVMKKQ